VKRERTFVSGLTPVSNTQQDFQSALRTMLPTLHFRGPLLRVLTIPRSWPLRMLFAVVVLAFASAHAQTTGLTGQYYDNAGFTALTTTRVDATVNFNWDTSAPSGTAITNGDTFSVAWSGKLEPEFSTGEIWIPSTTYQWRPRQPGSNRKAASAWRQIPAIANIAWSMGSLRSLRRCKSSNRDSNP
jgi:PA14 domain